MPYKVHLGIIWQYLIVNIFLDFSDHMNYSGDSRVGTHNSNVLCFTKRKIKHAQEMLPQTMRVIQEFSYGSNMAF